MMTPDEARRELRRLLPEFAAAIEEFRSAWQTPGLAPPPHTTYGEAMLVTVSPILTAFAESCRSSLDEIDDDEALALISVVSMAVEQRHEARTNHERRHGSRTSPW